MKNITISAACLIADNYGDDSYFSRRRQVIHNVGHPRRWTKICMKPLSANICFKHKRAMKFTRCNEYLPTMLVFRNDLWRPLRSGVDLKNWLHANWNRRRMGHFSSKKIETRPTINLMYHPPTLKNHMESLKLIPFEMRPISIICGASKKTNHVWK